MTSSSSPRLAAADRMLLRQVFAWGHASGWSYIRTRHDYNFEHSSIASIDVSDELRHVTAYYWRDCGQHHVSFWPESVTEAIDVLVALGILPAQLSSQFRAGARAMSDLAAGVGIKSVHVELPDDDYDPYDPADADERAENDGERIAEMTPDELARWGE